MKNSFTDEEKEHFRSLGYTLDFESKHYTKLSKNGEVIYFDEFDEDLDVIRNIITQNERDQKLNQLLK